VKDLLSPIRDARWLSDVRARAVRNVLLLLLPSLAILWMLLGRDGIDPVGKPIGTDYLSFWTAARFAVAGEPSAAYDIAAHHSAQRSAAGPDTAYSAFFYPPTFLLALLPFGFLPYLASLAAWLGVTFFAYARVVRAWAADWQSALLALVAFPAILINAGHGQNGFLTAALLGGGSLLVARRPWLAGALLGALIIKPHLALVVPFALLFRGAWKSIAGAALSACLLSALSLLLFGRRSWQGFLDGAPLAQATLERGLVDPAKMQSVFAAVRMFGGSIELAYGLQAATAAATIAGLLHLARIKADARAQGAAMVAGAMLATPFLLDYDLTIAAIPLVWLMIEARRTSFLPWEKAGLAAAFLLPLVSRSLAQATGVPLAPLVVGALFLLVLRRARSNHRHPAVDVQGLPGDVGRLAAG
jgi:hypothetical protein